MLSKADDSLANTPRALSAKLTNVTFLNWLRKTFVSSLYFSFFLDKSFFKFNNNNISKRFYIARILKPL